VVHQYNRWSERAWVQIPLSSTYLLLSSPAFDRLTMWEVHFCSDTGQGAEWQVLTPIARLLAQADVCNLALELSSIPFLNNMRLPGTQHRNTRQDDEQGWSLVGDMIAHKLEAAYIKSASRSSWTMPDCMYTRL
jgi:hypothetical protein